MPIYEYICMSCAAQFQCLIMGSEQEEPACKECGGTRLKRLISRTAYHVSEKDRLERFNPDGAKDDSFYRDSRNIGLSAKKRAKEMGVDLGSGFEEKLDRLRSDPGSVLKENE